MSKIAFRSKNHADVLQAAELEVWQHTRNAKKAQVGDKIYIFTSAKGLRDTIGLDFKDQLVCVGEITAIEPPQKAVDWVSKDEYGSELYRFSRKCVVPLCDLPEVDRSQLQSARQQSIIYMNEG